MNIYFRALRILAGLGGCLLASAAIPLFFPTSLMATIHAALDLGEFPQQPIAVYLAKSTSLMYAVHGVVMLYVACDFKRCRHFIPLLGWLHVAIGAAALYIDLAAPMPGWWTAGEGPPVIGFGLLFLWLYRQGMRKRTPPS
jgi:hypothetical protein